MRLEARETMTQKIDWTRRHFMATAASAAGLALLPRRSAADHEAWNSGSLEHLLPTASHDRIAIKATFTEALEGPVFLNAGNRQVSGKSTDSDGRFFAFDIGDLEADVEYTLQFVDAGGGALCDSWPLRTFPNPDARPEHVRLLAFTCAGGHPADTYWYLPIEVRRRLLRRALSFNPRAVIAIGDHVYWDQRTELYNRGEKWGRKTRELYERVGWLDLAQPALGTSNEAPLKAAVGPQIGQLYGTLLRSTPSYFVSDDHDYFENDDADDRMVTFPPDHYQVEFARLTRLWYLPEFLPDPGRSLAIPGTSARDRAPGTSEAFGTLRYGRLLEALIYDCARYLSLKGPHAGLIPPEAERWLHQRTLDESVAQLLHVPSHPMGWSAGKWREWYPDAVDTGKRGSATAAICCDVGDQRFRLTHERDKYMWQTGWWKQHQHLVASLSAQKKRAGIVLSGDLHAIGHAALERSGDIDLSKNPLHSVLTGTLGTKNGWPSDARGTPPQTAIGLSHATHGEVLEKNGFTLLDVTPEEVTIRLFAWKSGEPLEAIDALEPYHTFAIRRS